MLRYFFIPVPAGMSLPMMTFSLSPSNLSFFPLIAASVSTLVVSWKEAADKNEFVARDAFVIPSSTRFPLAGVLPSASAMLLASASSNLVYMLPGRRSVSPGSSILNFDSIWLAIISMCLSLMSTPWFL